MSPESVMAETAKLYVVLKEIILGMQHDTKRALEIIDSIAEKISQLKREVAVLKIQQEENNKKIENLEKSIKYFEKFLNMAA